MSDQRLQESSSESVRCHHCQGRGFRLREKEKIRRGGGTTERYTCPDCGGSGKVPVHAENGPWVIRLCEDMRQHHCEFCGGTFTIADDDPWCCAEQEAEFAKFMASVNLKRDEMFWAIVGETP